MIVQIAIYIIFIKGGINLFTKEKITSVAMIFVLLINTFLSSIGVVYALDDGSEELIVDEVIDSIMEEDCEITKKTRKRTKYKKKKMKKIDILA